jgi:hypothetical protein
MWALILVVSIVSLVLVSIMFARGRRRKRGRSCGRCKSARCCGDDEDGSDSGSSSNYYGPTGAPHSICGIQVVSERLLGGPLALGTRVSASAMCPFGTTLVGGGATVIETGAIAGQIVALLASIPTGPADLPPDGMLGSFVVVAGPANAGIEVTAICAEIC